MIDINDLTITSLDTITVYDLATGDYRFMLDELRNVSISQEEEKTSILGRGGRKLNSLKKNKTVTISGANGLISGGLLEVQTGGRFERKAAEVFWTDYLRVTSSKAMTNYKAVGTVGAEINTLAIKNSDGLLIAALKQSSKPGVGTFTYSPSTKELTFGSDIEDGTEIMVKYKRKINAGVLSNRSNSYSEKCALYIDAVAEDKCTKVYRVQIFFPKADFSGEFSMEFGGDQSMHSFEAETLPGGCGVDPNLLWTYTVFGDDAEDDESVRIESFKAEKSTVELGDVAKLSWTLSSLPVAATVNGTNVLGMDTYTSTPITKTTSFSLSVTDAKGNKDSKSISVAGSNSILIGASPSTSANQSILAGFSKILSETIARKLGKINCGQGAYVYYAFPSRLGQVKMTQYGIEGGFEDPVQVEYTNSKGYRETYNVYRSSYLLTGEIDEMQAIKV